MLSPGEALAEPQNSENGFVDWKAADGPAARLPFLTPFRLSGTPSQKAAVPELGQGSRAVLHSCGFSDADINEYRDAGVLKLGDEFAAAPSLVG